MNAAIASRTITQIIIKAISEEPAPILAGALEGGSEVAFMITLACFEIVRT